MAQKQHPSRVDTNQREAKCLRSYEDYSLLNFLKNFISDCKTFLANLYQKDACQNRRLLMNPDPDNLQNLLRLLIMQWCVTRGGSHRGLEHLEEMPDSLDIDDIVDKIIKESQPGVVVVGVTYLIGYQFDNKYHYVTPVFRVYRSEWDQEPIFVDTDAKVYKNIADCLALINLPESIVCLPLDGVFQFDHHWNTLPLGFYIKQSRSAAVSYRWPIFLSIVPISIISLILIDAFKRFAPSFYDELTSDVHIQNFIKCIENTGNQFCKLVKRNFTVSNLLKMFKLCLLSYNAYLGSSYYMSNLGIHLFSNFMNWLSTCSNISISLKNKALIETIIITIIDDVASHLFQGSTSIWNLDNLKKIAWGMLSMKIWGAIVTTHLPNVFEFLSLMNNDQTEIEDLQSLSLGILKKFNIFCDLLKISRQISFSSLFRPLYCMFKNFMSRKIEKESPSKKMAKKMDPTGEDCRLSNYLRNRGLEEGKLNEEGKMCLEDIEITENVTDLVHVSSHDRKNLFLINAPLIQAANVVRSFFKIPHSVPFEIKDDDFGMFHNEVKGETFTLYNYKDDDFNCTFIKLDLN